MRSGLLKKYDFWGVLLLILIFAALVTPADLASTLMVAAPLFAVYLLVVVCLRLVLKGK
jgi:Sec-independent protein secretion pathway component TatC